MGGDSLTIPSKGFGFRYIHWKLIWGLSLTGKAIYLIAAVLFINVPWNFFQMINPSEESDSSASPPQASSAPSYSVSIPSMLLRALSWNVAQIGCQLSETVPFKESIKVGKNNIYIQHLKLYEWLIFVDTCEDCKESFRLWFTDKLHSRIKIHT